MKIFITIMVLLLLIGGGTYAYLFFQPAQNITLSKNLPTTMLMIQNVLVEAEVAATPAEQEQGLSNRESLAEGKAMLFKFERPDLWGIWMKDMRFSIDILWADQAGTILHIEEAVPPESFPDAFYPPAAASYVVELPAGFVKKHSIAVGGKIVVQ